MFSNSPKSPVLIATKEMNPVIIININLMLQKQAALEELKFIIFESYHKTSNRPCSYSTKEPGSSDIFRQFYTRGSTEWRETFDRNCAHSKILQIVMKYRSIYIRCENS